MRTPTRLLLPLALLLCLGTGMSRSASVTFVVGNTNGITNAQVVVPIRAVDFTNINAVQFTLRWQTNVAAFVGLEQLGLPGMAIGNFNTNFARGYTNLPGNPGIIMMQWDHPSGGGVNLGSNGIVFSIRLRLVGTVGATSPVVIDGSVTAFEAINGSFLVVPVSAVNGIITIIEPNTNAPVLATIGSRSADEGTELSFTASAVDDDSPTQILTYSLSNAPAGAVINASSGLFTWTPTEAQGPGVYPVTIRVTDNGQPAALNDTETFSITVNELNSAPVLTAIGNLNANEGGLLSFNATATDSDLPVQTLTYTLEGAVPSGASITTGGAFTWTPTEAQGPSTNTFTVRVTDNGSPAANDFEVITITVGEANGAPVLSAVGNRAVNEGALLSFTANANDSDNPAQTLTFTLDAGAPSGASINPSSGAFTWTPTEAQGASNHIVTVRVTDNGTPALSDFETITITVAEVNTAPTLGSIGNQTMNELTTLAFGAAGSDVDLPANTLTYSLSNAPAGAAIHPSNGTFTWTPTETQGPGSYLFTVRVMDNGLPTLSASETITISVNELNVAPTLAFIGDRTVVKNTLLSFATAGSDSDQPAQTLTYSLEAGAPTGASIHPTTGIFSWTPANNQGPATYTITVRVTDNGPGLLFTTRTFSVIVFNDNTPPLLAPIGHKEVMMQTLLTFQATATDAESSSQILTYTLEGAPVGATINPSTGVFTWTPMDAQSPSTNLLTVRVTDNAFVPASDFETIQIIVSVLPVIITTQPTSQTVSDGQSVNFSVTASGSAPTYQWRKNGTNILGATNATLLFSPAQTSDAGIYSVTVSNKLGAIVSSNAALIVIPFGTPVVRANGDIVTGTVTLESSTTLTLATAFPQGYIFYTLDGSAPTFSSPLYSGPIPVGNSVVVRALALSLDFSQVAESPPVTIVLLLYTVSVTSGGAGVAAVSPAQPYYASNSLVTLSATPSSGWNFLRWEGDASGSSNPLGLTVYRSLQVQAVFGTSLLTNVVGSGRIEISPSGPVPFGSTVELRAVPAPGQKFVAWGNAVSGTNNPRSFTVTQPSPTVAALFAAGSAGIPVITSHPSNRVAVAGGNFTLSVGASGSPPLLVQWRLNGAPLTGETNATLNIGDASGAQAGTYDAVVTGPDGTAVSAKAAVLVTVFDVRPVVSILGAAGIGFRVDYTDDLDGGSWLLLTNGVLSVERQEVIDFTSTNRARRFYRTLVEP